MIFRMLPRRMDDGPIGLKPLGVRACVLLGRFPGSEETAQALGLGDPPPSSWPALRFRLAKLLPISYRIEHAERLVGLIGLCRLYPPDSAGIALAIFDRECRRRGYGSAAFGLLARVLKRYSVAREVIAQVASENPAALLFWKKLGFEETGREGKRITLSRELYTNSPPK